jgi:hypothetical protein
MSTRPLETRRPEIRPLHPQSPTARIRLTVETIKIHSKSTVPTFYSSSKALD